MNTSLQKITVGVSAFALVTALSGCGLFQNTQSYEEQKAADQKKIDALQSQVQDLQTQLSQKTQEEQTTQSTVETSETAGMTEQNTQQTEMTTAPKTSYTGKSFITMNSPDNNTSVYEEPVNFSGNVSPNTVKVTVKATNSSSTNVDDYVLQNYKAGDTKFTYGAAGKWNNLKEGTNTYVFTAYFEDGTSKSTSLTEYYAPGGAEMGKPVIYLYPQQTTQVSVNVEPTNGISISDPPINNGWNVIATPEGKITNLADNKTYPYLFWEGYAANFVTPKEGFVVAQKDIPGFFDDKLSYMGLNAQEISDFKDYWVPKLDEKPYYFITFIDQTSIDRYAPLSVTPKPDSVIRVFFDYKGLEQNTTVPEQELKAGTRNGFTVTEWGGRLYRS